MNVVVNGLMTNYQKAGKGKTLVLLHGWGDSSKTFSALASSLQGSYEILAPDLPGFGGSQAPPGAWGSENYADFIKAWLDKLGVKNVYGIIGHSYGGTVAISAVGKGKLEPQKLVLLASSGIRDVQRLKKVTLKTVSKLAKLPIKALPAATQNKIKRKAYGAVGSDALLLPHMQPTLKRILGEDMQITASNITTPTLIIYGNKDKDTPPLYGRLFKGAIKGSRLEIIDAGHFLHQEQPDIVADMVADFLKANNG